MDGDCDATRPSRGHNEPPLTFARRRQLYELALALAEQVWKGAKPYELRLLRRMLGTLVGEDD